jgi:hypothetical protein
MSKKEFKAENSYTKDKSKAKPSLQKISDGYGKANKLNYKEVKELGFRMDKFTFGEKRLKKSK